MNYGKIVDIDTEWVKSTSSNGSDRSYRTYAPIVEYDYLGTTYKAKGSVRTKNKNIKGYNEFCER